MKIKEEIIRKIENNWILASQKLNFEIVCPFVFKHNDKERKVFAFLPAYGSKKGMIIDLTSPPKYDTDKEVIEFALENNYYYSFINIERYLNYDEGLFIQTLEDWGNFAPSLR